MPGLLLEQSPCFKTLPRFRDSLFPMLIRKGFGGLGDLDPLPSLHRFPCPEEIRQGILGGAVAATYPDALQVMTLEAIPDPAPETGEVRLLSLNPGADPGRFFKGQEGVVHRIDAHSVSFPAAARARSCSSSAASSSASFFVASSSCSSSCSRNL